MATNIRDILNGLSPQERQRMLLASLGGGMAQAANLGPNAGIGRMLLALGGGALQGQQQGLGDIEAGRYRQKATDLQDRRLQQEEASLADEQAERQRQAELIASLPPETQRLVQLSKLGGAPLLEATGLGPKKPPPTRDRFSGSMTINEEFDPQTGQWTQVGAGPRWAPQQPREGSEFERLLGAMPADQRAALLAGRVREMAGQGNGEATASLRTRSQKIADAQRLYQIPEADAVSLVDGYASIVTDPVTGKSMLANKATRDAKPIEVPRQQMPLTGAAAPPPSIEAVAGATGVSGVATELAAKTLGQVDPSFVDQANTEARAQLRGLKQRLTYALSVSGRPPVIEQERITGLLPSEGVMESPQRAKAVFNNLRDTLVRQRDADAEYINSGIAAASETPDLKRRVYELDQIIRELGTGTAAPAAGTPAKKRIRLDAEGNIRD